MKKQKSMNRKENLPFQIRNPILLPFVIMMALVTVSCSSASSSPTRNGGLPDGFIGQWKCEKTASDGKTDTSFYEMYIEEDGHFSLYDAAAGNPGISGRMENDTGSTVECEFDMDDFDVPFCWTIRSSKATLGYELDGDTLKLCHNDVWMTFHRIVEKDPPPVPEPLDDLLSLSLPAGFVPEEEFFYDGIEGNVIVERSYASERDGYFSAGIFSYCGFDCFGDIKQEMNLEENIAALENMRQIEINGETGYFGTHESDDMPDMVAVIYVSRGDYVFTFRLSNYDEQVTKEQLAKFEQTVTSVTFKY